LERHPDYVVKRYESGGVATNAECDAIYRQALERLGESTRRASSSYHFRSDNLSPATVPVSQPRIDASRYAVPDDSVRRPTTGMKGNPVHVIVDEGNVPQFFSLVYRF
jgi:Yme1-like, N-terminal